MKTAELFALSCDLAAFLSGTTPERRAALRQFGAAFGTAYQVYDDCVDLFGSEASAGKSLGTDLAKGKLTLPVLLVWERANRRRPGASGEGWWKTGSRRTCSAVNELLANYETLEPSLEVIMRYLEQARRALRLLPESNGRWGLSGSGRLFGATSRRFDGLYLK